MIGDQRHVLQAFRWPEAGYSDWFRAAMTPFYAAVTACGPYPSQSVQPLHWKPGGRDTHAIS